MLTINHISIKSKLILKTDSKSLTHDFWAILFHECPLVSMTWMKSATLENSGPYWLTQIKAPSPLRGCFQGEGLVCRRRGIGPQEEMILTLPCLTWTLGSALLLASVVHDQVHPLGNKHSHYNQSLHSGA